VIILKNIRIVDCGGGAFRYDGEAAALALHVGNFEARRIGGSLFQFTCSELRARASVPEYVRDEDLLQAAKLVARQTFDKASDIVLFAYGLLRKFADAAEIPDRLHACKDCLIRLFRAK
jgi:hypothetical protein